LQYLKFENTMKILVFLNGFMRNRNKLYIDPLLKLELLYFGNCCYLFKSIKTMHQGGCKHEKIFHLIFTHICCKVVFEQLSKFIGKEPSKSLLPKFLQCAQTSTLKIEPRLDDFCKCQKDDPKNQGLKLNN
jgi:hypothetical protein